MPRHFAIYFREFGAHWPTLMGATLGLALGAALNHYMTSLFAPPLIAEFGWDKSQFALVGTLGLATMTVVPFAGRITARYGERLRARHGIVPVPHPFLSLRVDLKN